jgi:hypothetical protein
MLFWYLLNIYFGESLQYCDQLRQKLYIIIDTALKIVTLKSTAIYLSG